MTKRAKTAAFLIAVGVLQSGCMGSSSGLSSQVAAMQGIAGVQRSAQATATKEDLAMSCPQIDAELKRHYARMEQINKAERARERQANLTGGLLDAGLSVVGAGAIANAGSAQTIRNVGTATTVAGSAASAATASAGPDAQTYNEALAISERSALLGRVKLQKGC